MSLRRLSTLGFARRFIAPKFPHIAEILEYPMVAVILARIDANPGAIFIIQGSPQIFKTLLGQIRALRSQLVESVSALWYGKNEVTAEQIAEEKFNPLYDQAMPTLSTKAGPVSALLYTDRNKRTRTKYTLPTGDQLLFLSAGVDINRQSKSASDIYLDEPWEYDPGWVKEIQRRREDNPRYREIHMQTGPTWGSYSHELWEQSTKEVWYLRCLKCRKLFSPEIGNGSDAGGLRWANGPEVRDAEDKRILPLTRATVTLECPHCLHRYENTNANRNALNAGGLFVGTNSTPEYHIHGFRVPALPLRDWGDIAIEKITADRARRRGDLSLTEDFQRKRVADVWREDAHLAEKRIRPIGGYKMGEEWADELKDEYGRPWRFATIDVQQDYFVLVIRMWGKWSRSRLRWASKPLSPTEIADTLKAHGVMSERVFVDARFEPQRVRRLAVNNGWKTLMGDKAQRDYQHEDGMRRIFDAPKPIDAWAGTEDQARRPVCVEILFSKQSALNRLHLLRTEVCRPNPEKPTEEEPIWTAASDSPNWYWAEIDAHFRKKEVARDGSEKWVWVGLKEDHAGDCEAMGVVVASMAQLTGAESLTVDTEPAKPAAAKS